MYISCRYNAQDEIESMMGYSDSDEPDDVTIDKNEAIKIAENTLEDMGIDYMTFVEVDYGYEYKDAHFLTFVRSIEGIPLTFAITDNMTGELYREAWPQEYVYVKVDDKSIRDLDWVSPSKLVEKLNEDVELMVFEDIMDIFEEQALVNVPYIGDSSDADYIMKRDIFIDRIVLGNMVVAKPNSQNEYLFVPVWDFFGYEVDTYSEDYLEVPDRYALDENNQRIIEIENYSHLTINAIDGTIIDRKMGY